MQKLVLLLFVAFVFQEQMAEIYGLHDSTSHPQNNPSESKLSHNLKSINPIPPKLFDVPLFPSSGHSGQIISLCYIHTIDQLHWKMCLPEPNVKQQGPPLPSFNIAESSQDVPQPEFSAVLSYNPVLFEGLPDLETAKATFHALNGSFALPRIGTVFSEFELQNDFGVILLHRHYNQASDEITVETVFESASISTPWKFSGNKLIKPTDFETAASLSEAMNASGTPSMDKILPHSWKFNNDSSTSPYEYVGVAEDDEIPRISEGFLRALYRKLNEFGLEVVLGLHWVHRETEGVAVETSLPNKRANVLQFKDQAPSDDLEDRESVMWRFLGPTGEDVQEFGNCTKKQHLTFD